MSSNQFIVNEIGHLLQTFADTYPEIIAIYLFGSIAQNKAHRQSDIDIALLFTPDLSAERRFQTKLLFGGQLETLLTVPLDVIDLNGAPLFLRFQVIKTGQLILERERTARCLFQMRTLSLYYDQKPYLDRQRLAAIQRIQVEGLGNGYRSHRNALAEARRLRQTLAPVAARPAG